ncbi:hypothetical protein CPB86DRAFT_792220 [Serendipita vermifera]|nr:hypothetical protein CPB86DRAFT_792220 [Serendipita vermifera]
MDDIFAVNQLEAMRLLETAWKSVSQETIMHCWQHTGILPQSIIPIGGQVDTVEKAVAEVENARNLLNNALQDRSGARGEGPRPALLPDVEEMLADIPDPEFELEEDEAKLIAMVAKEENQEEEGEDEDDEPNKTLPAHSSYIKMFIQIKELVHLRQNESDFQVLGDCIDRVMWALRKEQRNAMKDTEITAFFNPVLDSNEEEGELEAHDDDEDDIMEIEMVDEGGSLSE